MDYSYASNLTVRRSLTTSTNTLEFRLLVYELVSSGDNLIHKNCYGSTSQFLIQIFKRDQLPANRICYP